MASAPILVWLRNDLRLHDNPALHAAAETGRPILPVYTLGATYPLPCVDLARTRRRALADYRALSGSGPSAV